MLTYSSYYSSYHFARSSPSPLLSLRSAIAIPIIITSLDYRHPHYHHFARLSLSPSLSLRSAIAIPIIITSLDHRYPYYVTVRSGYDSGKD